jgi:hypothetical protein
LDFIYTGVKMANCRFCGEPVGLLKSKHKECELKFNSGKEQIINLVEKSLKSSTEPRIIAGDLKKISMNSFINGDLAKKISHRWLG